MYISCNILFIYAINNGRTQGVPFSGYGYVPLRNGGNVVTRMGTQQQHLCNNTLMPEFGNIYKIRSLQNAVSHLSANCYKNSELQIRGGPEDNSKITSYFSMKTYIVIPS